jgi:hypothetical protein
MTAPVRLPTIDGNELQRPQKSSHFLVSAELTLLTTYADVVTWTNGDSTQSGPVTSVAGSGAWIDVGNAPSVDVTAKWTHGATPTTLTLIAVGANWLTRDHSADPTIGRVLPYIPADTDGSTQVFEHELIFTKTNYTASSGFSSATVKYVGGLIKMCGMRALKLMAKSDSVTNTPVATFYVCAGTSE